MSAPIESRVSPESPQVSESPERTPESCRVGAMETCASAPQVSSVARSRQNPLLDQMRQDSCAGGLLDVPQPPSLTLRETETGHLHELHPDARHELAINRNRKCQHRLVLTLLMRRCFPRAAPPVDVAQSLALPYSTPSDVRQGQATPVRPAASTRRPSSRDVRQRRTSRARARQCRSASEICPRVGRVATDAVGYRIRFEAYGGLRDQCRRAPSRRRVAAGSVA